MDICDEILKLNEDTSFEYNEEMFKKVLEEYLSITGETYHFYSDTYLDKAINLKQQYIYPSNNKKIFIDILKKYNYNMRMDIIEAITSLTYLKNANRNKEIIKRFLLSPVIQDISFNGISKFRINSEYGNFSFNLANHYFKKNRVMNKYIENSILPNECHKHTEFMSRIFPNSYSTTSLCNYYFDDMFYHSYMESNDKIIDLANNVIMDKDKYNGLFGTIPLSSVLNSELNNEFEIIKNKTNQTNKYKLLKLALYKQFLKSINYTGSLEDAPKTYTI